MDLATIGGFLLAVLMIVAGASLEHVKPGSMLGLSAFLIVIGGSVGATLFSHTMDEIKQLPYVLKLAFAPPKLRHLEMIEYMVGLAEKARRSGILGLQEESESAPTHLIRRGLTMAADGSDPDVLQDILEAMSDIEAAELKRTGAIFDTAGGYAPTIGIMGTVMGLVTVMGNLSEPDSLGPSIAVAFLATLYGVGFANLLFLPLGAKIKAIVNQQTSFNEMVISAIVGLQSGENPRYMRERLLIYNSRLGKGGKPAKGDK